MVRRGECLLTLCWLGLSLVGVRGQTCNRATGGSCKFFNCKANRHAFCDSTDSTCKCPMGKCTDSNGHCHVDHEATTCQGEDWQFAHMAASGCSFEKNSGSGLAESDGPQVYNAHAVSDAYTVTSKDNVVGISWKAGDQGVVSIGMTTNAGDDRDFDNGVYLKQDAVGRFAGPSTGHYKADDVFTMKIACGAKTVDFYKNGVKFVEQESPNDAFPQTVYAKVWITDPHKSLEVTDILTLQNCEWGQWSAWSKCSVTCGKGSQSRARAVSAEARNCGTPCSGPSAGTQECSTGVDGHCPIDCQWGLWSDWDECTAKTGGGTKARTRTKAVAEAYGGQCHGFPSESVGCGMQAPPTSDCEWGAWESWSECSSTCGAGEKTRARAITKHSSYGGNVCDAYAKEVSNCGLETCADTDCAFGDWSSWGSCSVTCGTGQRAQRRAIVTQASVNGAPCQGPLVLEEECNVAPCSLVNTWKVADSVGALDVSNLIFTKTPEANEAVFTLAGTSMAADVQSIAVKVLGVGAVRFGLTTSPHDSRDFAKGAYKEITASKGTPATSIGIEGGHFVLYEDGAVVPGWGSAALEESMYAKIFIKDATAKVEVIFEKRNSASPPSVSELMQAPKSDFLAPGKEKLFDRRLSDVCNVDTGGSCGWFACKAERHSVCIDEACVCPIGTCTDTDGMCKVQHVTGSCGDNDHPTWRYSHMTDTPDSSDDGLCTFQKNSGSGMTEDPQKTYYGAAAVADASTVTKTNNVVGISWYAGAPGVVSMGLTTDPTDDRDFSHGVYLKLDDVGRFAGPSTGRYKADDVFTMSIACGAKAVDFYKNGVKFVSQDAPADDFPQTVYAKVWITDYNKAVHIKDIQMMRDCSWADWSPWTECSVTCGSGSQVSSRIEAVSAMHCGKPCEGPSNRTKTCTRGIEGHCPIVCEWGAWGEWSDCSATAGGGVRKRTREKTTEENYGGHCVGLASQSVSCGQAAPPPIDCAWGDWTLFADCSTTCGAGEKLRSRAIATHSSFGGEECHGYSKEAASCGNDPCPETDCAFSDWSEWGSCSAKCGAGVRRETRSIAVHESSGGKACEGNLVHEQECHLAPCDMLGQWTALGSAHLHEGDLMVDETANDATEWGASAITISSQLQSVAVKSLGEGTIRFGLTTSKDDDETFANGAYKELVGSSSPVTLAVEDGAFVVYADGVQGSADSTGAPKAKRGMFAKVFLKTADSKASIIYVKLNHANEVPDPALLAATSNRLTASSDSWIPAGMLALCTLVGTLLAYKLVMRRRDLAIVQEPLLA